MHRARRGVVVCCMALLVTGGKPGDEVAVDVNVYQDFMAAQVGDIYDLEEFFAGQQYNLLPIIPPDPELTLRQTGTPPLLPFTWKAFPVEFRKGLVSEFENSVPVYPITILEDPITRATVFLNAKGEKLLTLPPPPGYDPFEYVRLLIPSLYSGQYSALQILFWQKFYDPARIQISAKLILASDVEPYLYAADRIAEELAAESLSGGIVLLRSGSADSNIVFDAFSRTNGGVKMLIGYPNGFTNRLDVFTCNDLKEYKWTFAEKELSTSGTNEIAWLDTNYWVTAGQPVRFYAAGNADLDSDGDGYADAREIMVYRTDETDSNSRPVRVTGAVSYSGIETGKIYVIATISSGSWSIAQSSALPGPGAYTNDVANNQSYWFKAFRDVNTSYAREDWEPWGLYSNTALLVTADVSGINVTMQDQPSLWGEIDYAGGESGDIWVVAVTASNSWDTTYRCVIPWVQGGDPLTGGVTLVTFPAPYSITGLPATNCWIRAFVDSDTNEAYTHLEAAGQYTSNSVPVSNRVTGVDFALALDTDGDFMPDWWEWQYGFNPANSNDATQDFDDDGMLNADEYVAGTYPINPDSDGDTLSDGSEVANRTDPLNDDITPPTIVLAIPPQSQVWRILP